MLTCTTAQRKPSSARASMRSVTNWSPGHPRAKILLIICLHHKPRTVNGITLSKRTECSKDVYEIK